MMMMISFPRNWISRLFLSEFHFVFHVLQSCGRHPFPTTLHQTQHAAHPTFWCATQMYKINTSLDLQMKHASAFMESLLSNTSIWRKNPSHEAPSIAEVTCNWEEFTQCDRRLTIPRWMFLLAQISTPKSSLFFPQVVACFVHYFSTLIP